MPFDWNDARLLTCPAATSGGQALKCDGNRAEMVREGLALVDQVKGLEQSIKAARQLVEFYRAEAKALHLQLVDALSLNTGGPRG